MQDLTLQEIDPLALLLLTADFLGRNGAMPAGTGAYTLLAFAWGHGMGRRVFGYRMMCFWPTE
jgi:hypothetical protein